MEKREMKMDMETAVVIQRAFQECWKESPNLLEIIKKMVLVPVVEQGKRVTDSEVYAICVKYAKEEKMYVAKVFRNKKGRICKVNVAVHPPIREAAREWCEKRKISVN